MSLGLLATDITHHDMVARLILALFPFGDSDRPDHGILPIVLWHLPMRLSQSPRNFFLFLLLRLNQAHNGLTKMLGNSIAHLRYRANPSAREFRGSTMWPQALTGLRLL
jgi:hypothetical protein